MATHTEISARFSVLVLLMLPLVGCAATGFAGLKDCAPVYGNWCGKNYPHKGENPPAVDKWDAACRSHDRCYENGTKKDLCDRRFVATLERLGREQLVPLRMYNAHSWFRKDGWVAAVFRAQDEIWAAGASCKGGDGCPARFACSTAWNWCPLNPNRGGGHAGMPCYCNGVPGLIVEE